MARAWRGLLAAWLPLFFAPSLVNLPLSAFRPKGKELAKLTVVVVGGFFASLAGTALLAARLVGLKSTSAKEKAVGHFLPPRQWPRARAQRPRRRRGQRRGECTPPVRARALPVSAAVTAAGAAAVAVETLSQATAAASTSVAAKGGKAAASMVTAQAAAAAAAPPSRGDVPGFTAGVVLKSPVLHPVLLCAVATVAAAQCAAQALSLPLTTIPGAARLVPYCLHSDHPFCPSRCPCTAAAAS